MKRFRFTSALRLLSLLIGYLIIPTARAQDRTSSGLYLGKITALNLNSYEEFKAGIMPLIEQIGDKKIVSLGEGTHGTSEFYKVRFWISRILVEEKGFNHIAFENDYADSYLLNQQLLEGNADLRPLMKNYLISIWQNKETEELLSWMRAHNAKTARKVHFQGIDNVFLETDVIALKRLFAENPDAELARLLNKLHYHSAYQDSIWENQNSKDFKYIPEDVNANGVKGYLVAGQLETLFQQIHLEPETRSRAEALLMNNKQAFNTFYQWVSYKKGSSRDSCMAETTVKIASEKTDKLIIWAHNAHIARKGIYGGAVGGTGGFIEKCFPGQYFALGTGTATGTFLATTDRFDTRENIMKPYNLEDAIDKSWEKELQSVGLPAFYFSTGAVQSKAGKLRHRHIGYGPDSGKGSYDSTDLPELYDGFLFISKTSAAEFIK